MRPALEQLYLKLPLASPVIVGACPLTMQPEMVRQFCTAGVGAVVFPSIFQEQLERSPEFWDEPHPSQELAPFEQSYNGGPDRYLETIRQVRQTIAVPIIASMNGYAAGSWLTFAKQLEASGADALELNFQPIATSPEQSAGELENQLCDMVHSVCQSVSLPVAVKVSRHHACPANIVHRLKQVGAAGVVLFAHEVKWRVDADRLQWTPHWELTPVDSTASTLSGLIQAQMGVAGISVAASGGIRTADDAIKMLIAGADVVMITSELYRSGPVAIQRVTQGLEHYLSQKGFVSLADLRQARPRIAQRTEPTVRSDYLNPLTQSERYPDPTPVPPQQTGDRFGHPH